MFEKIQSLFTKPIQKPIQKPIIPRVPITIRIPTAGGPEDKYKKQLGILTKAYKVEIRRQGKWLTLPGQALPKGLALKKGAKRTLSTLAATFRLKQKGTTTKKDVGFKPSGIKFRRPKSGEKLTFVEKKQYRIKKGTQEISEILKGRKGRGPSKKKKASTKGRKKK